MMEAVMIDGGDGGNDGEDNCDGKFRRRNG